LVENLAILINEYSKGKIKATADNSGNIILFDIKTTSNTLTQVNVSSKPSVYLLSPFPSYSKNKAIK